MIAKFKGAQKVWPMLKHWLFSAGGILTLVTVLLSTTIGVLKITWNAATSAAEMKANVVTVQKDVAQVKEDVRDTKESIAKIEDHIWQLSNQRVGKQAPVHKVVTDESMR